MIAMLRGRIVDKTNPGRIVIDVAGVGYDVETSLTTFFSLESQENSVQILIHTIVREDAFLLYGFADKDERDLFRALIKVNGVGPKLAITILSSITPVDFAQCINSTNIDLLIKIPGIGRKTAERLVVEMKDSISKLEFSSKVSHGGKVKYEQVEEAIFALEGLGFKSQNVKKIIDEIADTNKTSEQLIREGLRLLSIL